MEYFDWYNKRVICLIRSTSGGRWDLKGLDLSASRQDMKSEAIK
jgi:hypothetical protein